MIFVKCAKMGKSAVNSNCVAYWLRGKENILREEE